MCVTNDSWRAKEAFKRAFAEMGMWVSFVLISTLVGTSCKCGVKPSICN